MNKDLSTVLKTIHDDLYHLQRNGLQSVIETYQDLYSTLESSLEKWLLEPTEDNWLVFIRQADIMERTFPKYNVDGIRDIRKSYELFFANAKKEETFDIEEVKDELPHNAIKPYYLSFC